MLKRKILTLCHIFWYLCKYWWITLLNFSPCRTLQQKSWHFLSRDLELYAFCQPMVLSLLSHFVSHQLQAALSHTRFGTFSVLCMCWYRYTYRFIWNWDYIKTHPYPPLCIQNTAHSQMAILYGGTMINWF